MKKLGYLRISTYEQCPDRQIDRLEEICDELHIETVSAVKANRPIYEKVISNLESGDTFVILDLDRAFRSVISALTEIDKLQARGIQLYIVNLQIDTSSPTGMFVYTIMSALAEFERRTLSQRTKEGMEAARRRGKRIGRPPKLTASQARVAKQQLDSGTISLAELAIQKNVSTWTLQRHIKELEKVPS